MIRLLAAQTWAHIAMGSVLMGSWAIFANRAHPMADSLQAGVLQGLLSGVLTACLKTVADRLRKGLPHWALAAGASLLFSATVLVLIHVAAGTPERTATVAVPLLVSGVYIFTYCYFRRRSSDG